MRELLKRVIPYGILVLLAMLLGCGHSEPKSSIVARVEQAGAGDLATVSTDDIRAWLGKHKDVAYQADEMCKPVRQNATAQWEQSTEGRLCTAARELAFLRGGPVTSDDKKYLPGLK